VSLPAHVRFGSFDLDLRAAELQHEGTKIKLPEQPFQILAELIEHPGEVVTREELCRRLWRSDTYVDFEHGLNTAVNRLREALGDSAEKPRYIETLPRHGYRLMVPVETPARPPGLVAGVFGARRMLWLAVSAFVLVAVVAGVSWWQWQGNHPMKVEALAVMPLENLSGNTEEEHFADSMTEALITELGKVRGLRVVPRRSVMHYKAMNKSVPEIARDLQVDALVEGSVLRSGDKVRITAQLVRANPEQHLWSESYERNLSDVIVLQREIAQAIAQEVRGMVATEKKRP
jgi:TolB-like protein/DNA-binding winged helix-turn-helix (wHTH) protein